MPITRKYHLKDLLAACKAYPLRPWEKLTFEYVLLNGVNDTDADARRVVKLLANLNCQGQPDRPQSGAWNPLRHAARRSASPASRRSSAADFPASCASRAGLDIYAACGQLKSTAQAVAEPAGPLPVLS